MKIDVKCLEIVLPGSESERANAIIVSLKALSLAPHIGIISTLVDTANQLPEK